MNTEKIFQFIRNNKILVAVVLLATLLVVGTVISSLRFRAENEVAQENPVKEYKVLAESKSLTFYRFDGKYFVLVEDIDKANPDIIRATLNIPAEIKFEVVYPNALNPIRIIHDQDEKQTINEGLDASAYD